MSFRRKSSSQSRCSCETRRETQRSRDDETCYGRKWEAAQGRNRGKRQKKLWTRRKGHRHFFQFWLSDGSGNWEMGRATQAEEFDYLFHTATAKLPFDETSQMTIRSKVRFNTGSCKQLFRLRPRSFAASAALLPTRQTCLRWYVLARCKQTPKPFECKPLAQLRKVFNCFCM